VAAGREHVVVIGAGVFGSWTAHHLLAAGHRVTLIDALGPANSLASSGLAPLGLADVADRVSHALPDVLGRDRDRFAGKHTTVVGAGHSAANTLLAIRGNTFRGYAHATRGILATSERHGMRLAQHRRGLIWQLIALERAG